MDNAIFEVARHIKWSKNKLGVTIIYDRIHKRSFSIDTTSGKIIWDAILRRNALKQIVEEIQQTFKLDERAVEIKKDITQFLSDLVDAGIVYLSNCERKDVSRI